MEKECANVEMYEEWTSNANVRPITEYANVEMNRARVVTIEEPVPPKPAPVIAPVAKQKQPLDEKNKTNNTVCRVDMNNDCMIEMDNIEPTNSNENNWSNNNTHTIEKWSKSVELTSFVYNDVLDKHTASVQIILIIVLVLGAIMTIISGINVALGTISSINSVWIVFGLNVALFCCAAGITIATGLIKINSWDDRITDYTIYIERLSALWVILKSELDMSAENRINAADFIKRMHGQYINLIQQGPQIGWKECQESTNKYKNKNFTNFKWNNKYGKTLEIV